MGPGGTAQHMNPVEGLTGFT